MVVVVVVWGGGAGPVTTPSRPERAEQHLSLLSPPHTGTGAEQQARETGGEVIQSPER